jgi:hypothetical protein
MPTVYFESDEMLPTDEWLDAELLDIEERDSTLKPGSVYWSWKWTISLPDGSTRVLYDASGCSLKPGTKPGKWVASLLGLPPKEVIGLPITTEDLTGKRCQLLLDLGQKQNGDEKNVILKTRPAPAARPVAVGTGPAPRTSEETFAATPA